MALLAPSTSALRLMLHHECKAFAVSRGLRFNSAKTQLIRFGSCQSSVCTDCFLFCGGTLPFFAFVIHLGHTLRHDLGDEDDIALRTHDMIWKANCIMRTFQGVDAVPMTRLYRSFCLSLHGSALWNLSCKAFYIVEVVFNNILRRIWRLPARTHTAILHSVDGLQSMYNTAAQRSKSLLCSIYNCPSHPVQPVFRHFVTSCYTFSGFNSMYVCFTIP